MNSELAALTPSPPWGRGLGRGGALYREFAHDLCVELITNQWRSTKIRRTPEVLVTLRDQFQTYTQ